MVAPRTGIQLVPTMGVGEAIETVQRAESLGYDDCMIADEGFMHDVYAVLGAVAGATDRIRVGAVTNPYTRHPAATAAALATVNELSGGRAFVTFVAGGSAVLHPMGLERTAPVRVLDDAIEICRRLWSGEAVDFEGSRFRLDGAQLSTGPHDIPIWVAARGERLLELTGRKADGVVLMAKTDLADALEVVGRAGRPVSRLYLDRLAFTPAMIEEAKSHYAYAILDSPPRMLHNLGIDEATVGAMREAFARGGPDAVAPLVSDEMVASYQIAGTRDSCESQLADLMERHRLDGFVLNVISPGLDANVELMTQVRDIVSGAASG
jgi:5,10-methylenetetrahydromethanopterin reductase